MALARERAEQHHPATDQAVTGLFSRIHADLRSILYRLPDAGDEFRTGIKDIVVLVRHMQTLAEVQRPRRGD